MEEKKRKGIEWIKEHKTELIIAGVSIGAILVSILKMKSCAMIEEKINELKGIVKNMQEVPQLIKETDNAEGICKRVVKENVVRVPHAVRMHPRNLPVGYRPSSTRIEAAAKCGCELLPGQTFVKAYHTGGNAA
ncbi:MAG: hypothetical protein IKB07_02680 [Lachnospiraceae bacterium]|nr:hypothetical protein [Lachnospiraceae bacterium]